MRSREVWHVVVAVLLVCGIGNPSQAQSKRSKSVPQTTMVPDPAKPTGETSEPEVGPYLKREGEKQWTLTCRVAVFSDRPDRFKEVKDPNSGQRAKMPEITPFSFETLGFIFPRIPSTASSEAADAAPSESSVGEDYFRGEFRVDGELTDSFPQMLQGFPFGTELARWDVGDRGKTTEARKIQLEVAIPVTTWKVTYDEAAAIQVPWPQSWPLAAQNGLDSQLYVEEGYDKTGKLIKYDFQNIDRALELWKQEWKIADFRSVTPAALAKMITSKVWEQVQPSGAGISVRPRTGELMGVDLQNPAQTLVTGRGSEHDLVVLTVALMRKAGLPARTVIGYDAGDKSDRWLDKGNKSSKLRSWLEFCVYDESRNTINWIPVDVLKLRRISNRPAPVTKEWRYFGTNDDFDHIIPFAFHFHPPTDVVSYGAPGFWGWFVTPKPPDEAEQSISVSAASRAVRGNDDDKRRPSRSK